MPAVFHGLLDHFVVVLCYALSYVVYVTSQTQTNYRPGCKAGSKRRINNKGKNLLQLLHDFHIRLLVFFVCCDKGGDLALQIFKPNLECRDLLLLSKRLRKDIGFFVVLDGH